MRDCVQLDKGFCDGLRIMGFEQLASDLGDFFFRLGGEHRVGHQTRLVLRANVVGGRGAGPAHLDAGPLQNALGLTTAQRRGP